MVPFDEILPATGAGNLYHFGDGASVEVLQQGRKAIGTWAYLGPNPRLGAAADKCLHRHAPRTIGQTINTHAVAAVGLTLDTDAIQSPDVLAIHAHGTASLHFGRHAAPTTRLHQRHQRLAHCGAHSERTRHGVTGFGHFARVVDASESRAAAHKGACGDGAGCADAPVVVHHELVHPVELKLHQVGGLASGLVDPNGDIADNASGNAQLAAAVERRHRRVVHVHPNLGADSVVVEEDSGAVAILVQIQDRGRPA